MQPPTCGRHNSGDLHDTCTILINKTVDIDIECETIFEYYINWYQTEILGIQNSLPYTIYETAINPPSQ